MASGRPFRRRDLAPLAALVLGGCATLRSPPAVPPESLRGAVYVVEPGDTLASIASRHGVSTRHLAQANGLHVDQSLDPGRVIFLPISDSRPAATTEPRLAAVLIKETAPLRWPIDLPRLSSPFGARWGRAHEGIDLVAPLGTPIHAAQGGQVVYAGDGVRGYGKMVVLRHDGDLMTVYAHTSVMLVHAGQRIAPGQEIARVGQSGHATGPHLHFEVRRGQIPQDPLRFLPRAALASRPEKQ